METSLFKRVRLTFTKSNRRNVAKVNEMMKVYIDACDAACEESKLDTQRLKNLVRGTNYVCTNDPRLADIIVLYTCGHLQKYENESLRMIRRLMSLKKSTGTLVVWGCLPEINPEAVRSVYDGCMIGPEHWDFFCDLFNQSKERIHNVHANELCTINKLANPSLRSPLRYLDTLFDKSYQKSKPIWYIKIVSGCREKCTYCSDRLAFKHCRSQAIDTIISQFELGLKSGFENFYLVGRDLGSYGYDLGTDLPTLLNKMLENHRAENYKLILFNISPRSLVDFYPRLKELLSSGKICQIGSHIQSGSDRILRLMGKGKLSINEWLKTVKEIREKRPDIGLATSIMVGFPTETEQDFEKTMALLDGMLFDHVSVYIYEGRPSAPSLRLGGLVQHRVAEERLDRIRRKVILNNINKNTRRIEIGPLIQSLISYANLLVDKHERRACWDSNKIVANTTEFYDDVDESISEF